MIDAETGLPAELDPNPFKELLDLQRDGQVQNEFLACQIEHASSICHEHHQALEELRSFRTALARQASDIGLMVAGLGTAPMVPQEPPRITGVQRYREIAASLAGIAAEHYTCGLHIHISIPERDSGVKALNFLRGWLPMLCAVGANSPYWRGADTNFASWRTIQYRQWSITGIPPHFENAGDYDRRLAALLGADSIPDEGHIGWAVRLSEHYPTIELRVADWQLRAQDSVLLAVLARALVDTAIAQREPLVDYRPEILDLAFWQAAKHGIEGPHMDPVDGASVTTRDLVGRMLRLVEPELRRTGDYDFVVHSLRNMLETGNGAVRQRAAYDRGAFSHVLENAHAEMLM